MYVTKIDVVRTYLKCPFNRSLSRRIVLELVLFCIVASPLISILVFLASTMEKIQKIRDLERLCKDDIKNANNLIAVRQVSNQYSCSFITLFPMRSMESDLIYRLHPIRRRILM